MLPLKSKQNGRLWELCLIPNSSKIRITASLERGTQANGKGEQGLSKAVLGKCCFQRAELALGDGGEPQVREQSYGKRTQPELCQL